MLKLTRLKLFGFKSFYAKTEISFPGGITAVVGPNGCGKSNISDAISWVLGEQSSKSLRGAKMEDVIFNGSERRGPLPMAEVTLTLTWDSTIGNIFGNGNGHGSDVAEDLALLKSAGPVPVESETFHPRPEVFAAALAATAASPSEPTAEAVTVADEDTASEPAAEAGPQAEGTEGAADGDQNDGTTASPEPEAPAVKKAPPAFRVPTEDGTEISVSRRLYRSGESEYRIDDRRVRLLDVQALMQAARIGTRTYAVIEQDRISALLSARAKERKAMIEEAAGILGIKARRRTAILKLEHTETNLSRLRDLVAEVTRQVNSLKRQAAKARRYRRNSEEIRHQRRLLFGLDHRRLEDSLRELAQALQGLRSSESAAAAEVSRCDAAVEGLRQRIDEDGQDAGVRRDELHSAEREVERLDGDRRALAERIREATEMSQRCAGQALALRQRSAESLETAAKRDEERVAAAADVERLQDEVTRLEEAYTTQLAAADAASQGNEADRSRLLEAVSRLGEARNRAHKLEERGHRMAKQRERLEREQEACRLELKEDEDRLAAAAAELEAGSLALAAAEADSQSAMEARRLASSTATERSEELTAARNQLQACDERASALASLWHASREEDSTSGEGVALGEGVEVDGPWEDAAGAWAEGVLQARQVADVATAMAVVRRARESADGRVRLAVKELMPARAAAPGHLSSVLKGNAEHAGMLSAILQDPELVADLDEAVARWRQAPGRPYLTREGDGITAAGLIIGGPKGEGARLLACNRQRREALEEAESLRRRLPGLEEAAETSARAMAAAVTAEENSQIHLQKVRHDLVEQRTLHERFQEATGRQMRRRDVLLEEETVLSAEEEEHRREMALATGEAQTADSQRVDAERAVQTSQVALDALRRQIHDLATERTEGRAAAAARQEVLAALAQDVERLRREAVEHQERAQADEEESAARATVADELRHEYEVVGRSREDLMDGVVKLRERCKADEMSLQESRGALAVAEAEARAAHAVLDEAREKTRLRELDLAKGEAEREHLVRECQDEFQCAPTELAASLTEEDGQVNPAAVREEVVRLESIRERIGPVNMMAIDQFSEEEERQTYLLGQQEDLESSIRSLRLTIQKIDKTSRERFVVALEAIRADFSSIFKELFGGGVADIELQEPDNVLESGIEIIAQPPGKRTRNINLLSGGEKAMSAIALLFAIFKYRPSPFCLLDEADAALDEANVERFTRLLKSYGGDTQFILITHNRRSMEVADVMYGVTMEEPGVSQTVSMGLN